MASGAEILIINGVVIKANGGSRIDEQAAWLQRYTGSGLVKVLGSWHGGYAMEQLDVQHQPVTAVDILNLLSKFVWCHAPQVEVDWPKLGAYAINLAQAHWPDAMLRIKLDLDALPHLDLACARVHGDPTFENVMSRDKEFVLIDPIPGRYYAPDLIAVDMGKILQSQCGYEAVLAGDEHVPTPSDELDWLNLFEDDDVFAAKFFGVLHVCRFLPYIQDDMIRDRLRRIVGESMLRL